MNVCLALFLVGRRMGFNVGVGNKFTGEKLKQFKHETEGLLRTEEGRTVCVFCFLSARFYFLDSLVSDFVTCMKSFEKITPFAARVCCFADVSSICVTYSQNCAAVSKPMV